MARRIDADATPSGRRLARLVIALGLTVAAVAPALAAAASKGVHNGIYASKASHRTPYSNGAVDLTVYGGGRKISPTTSGMSCYTGSNPPAGVPTDDEVTVRLPHTLTISASKRFSFSGPITISAADAQSTQPISTTFSLKGRFVKGKHGTFTATGTAFSPVCQASTPTHFTSPYGGVNL
jgi:hypothetical protein